MLKKLLAGISLIIPFVNPASIFALETCGENTPQPGVEAVQLDDLGNVFKYRSTIAVRVPKDNTTLLLSAKKIAKRKARAGFIEFWNDAELEEKCATGDSLEQNLGVTTEGDAIAENTNTNQAYKVTCEILDVFRGSLKGAEFGGDCQVGDTYFYSLIISPESVNAALGGQALMKKNQQELNLNNQSTDDKVKFNTYDKYEF